MVLEKLSNYQIKGTIELGQGYSSGVEHLTNTHEAPSSITG